MDLALPEGSSPETVRREFSRFLRVLRARRSMTQAELASISGVHRTFVSRAETGKILPSLLTVTRLAQALGVDRVRILLRYSAPER